MLNKKQLDKQVKGVNPFGKMLKDADGDKVPNVFDCKPHDKNRQGIIHDVKSKFKKYREEKRELRKATSKVAKEERMKQAIKTARYKEEVKGKKQRASYSGGGGFNFGSALGSLAGTPTKTTAAAPRTTTKMVKTTRHVKGKGGVLKKVSGYKKVKVKVPVKTKATSQPTLTLNDMI